MTQKPPHLSHKPTNEMSDVRCTMFDLATASVAAYLSFSRRRWCFVVMKTKLTLKVVGLIGVLALISAGYCFWLMTVQLSYDWVPVVVIGFVVSIGVFVISLISSFIVLIRLRRSRRSSHTPQIRPTI